MCGRFVSAHPPEELVEVFDAAPANDLPVTPNYNVCPTDNISAIVGGERRRLVSMRWGFVPNWYKTVNDGPLLVNARADTLAEKPAFREACRSRRCLIPATGYYEWSKAADGTRLPWYIQRADQNPVAFAGIWQRWEMAGMSMVTCAIVTTSASNAMSGVHHRMPVVLAPESWALWLGEAGKGAATLMRPAPDDVLQFHRVGLEVNSSRAEGAGLIDLQEV